MTGEDSDLGCFGRFGGLEVEGWGPGALWRLRTPGRGWEGGWRWLEFSDGFGGFGISKGLTWNKATIAV